MADSPNVTSMVSRQHAASRLSAQGDLDPGLIVIVHDHEIGPQLLSRHKSPARDASFCSSVLPDSFAACARLHARALIGSMYASTPCSVCDFHHGSSPLQPLRHRLPPFSAGGNAADLLVPLALGGNRRRPRRFSVMLAHNFPCLIHRLIFEAIIRFFYHDSSNKRRLGIMAKAGSLPLRVLALHGPNQMIT